MNTEKQQCHCGHDKSTHYHDEEGSGDCLATSCDCACYKHVDEPGTYRKQRKWADNGPDTPRVTDDWWNRSYRP